MAEPTPAPAPTPEPTPAPAPNPAPSPDPAHPAGGADPKGDKPGGADPTIMESPDGSPTPSGPASWDVLRKLAADGDESLEKELARHTDLKSLAKSWKEQKAELSKRQAKTDLSKDATDEQKAEWRKNNGIPEKASDYKIELGDGLVVGEADKPIVDKFLGVAHEKGWKQDQVNDALGFYFQLKDQEEAEIVNTVKSARIQTEESLRQEWGPEYRSNVNAGYTLLQQTFGKETAALIISARGDDNIPLGSRPEWLKGMAKLAREINPAAALMPTSTANAAGVETEIEQIEGVMKNDRAKYNADEKMQARLRDLYSARERMGGKKAA
jgi:hypothetical protein